MKRLAILFLSFAVSGTAAAQKSREVCSAEATARGLRGVDYIEYRDRCTGQKTIVDKKEVVTVSRYLYDGWELNSSTYVHPNTVGFVLRKGASVVLCIASADPGASLTTKMCRDLD